MTAAAGVIGFPVFTGKAEKSGLTQRQADIALNSGLVAIVLEKLSLVDGQAAAITIVLEDEVDHAGDGVGTVLRCCTVPQYFNVF